ncbi:hypothetical protein Tsubulata_041801 [Turnera subulata]|uniref:Uncharacterized protein n=1 Tax=Turnera subulata TaxID=218843 RepID=A0A9Q0F4S1_9ROSI|nr:hypothetical protein Tsubulata_041801 [Turnera subulata]
MQRSIHSKKNSELPIAIAVPVYYSASPKNIIGLLLVKGFLGGDINSSQFSVHLMNAQKREYDVSCMDF